MKLGIANHSFFRTVMVFSVGGVLSLVLGCSSKQKKQEADAPVEKIKSIVLPSVTNTEQVASNDPWLSGLSALQFEKQEGHKYWFWTLTDRGPNLESEDKKTRIFPLPQYKPQLILFNVDLATGAVGVDKRVMMDGSGLPNKEEIGTDKNGKRLKPDPKGLDPESLAKVGDQFWVGEEYGPSIVNFDAKGKVLARYRPGPGKNDLPPIYAERSLNRGFEALAYDSGKIYAVLQSPIPADAKLGKLFVRILEWDIKLKRATGEYFYPIADGKVDKIGDMTALGGREFLIVEQNSKTGMDGTHWLRRFDLKTATNMLGQKTFDVNKITYAHIQSTCDLTRSGFDFAEKIEGLALVNPTTAAIVNDDDFQIFQAVRGEIGFVNLTSCLK